MSIYTVSPDLLENIEEDEKIYLTEILFVFTTRGDLHKVAKDNKGEILDIYRGIKNNADFIKVWLELMSFKPAKFENIEANLSEIECVESKFLELCSRTQNIKQMIVYSTENFKKFQCKSNTIFYKNQNLRIFDRDEANVVLNKKLNIVQNNFNSQVASHGSSIIDSTNY